jgi:hypothetical protein
MRVAAFTVLLAAVIAVTIVLIGGGNRSPGDGPPSDQGTVLWNGDLAGGSLDQYTVQACAPDRTQVVRDPLGRNRNALKFTVRDTDVKPCSPTENPRAQALSPPILRDGGEYWVGWALLVPNDFPRSTVPGDNWINVGAVYGPPFDGSGPNALNINTTPGREKFYFRRNATGGYQEHWQIPLVRGRWVDFAIRLKMSHDASVGFREQWVNTGSGWAQSLFEGRRRLHMETLDESNDDGANFSKIGLYYRRGLFDGASLYFAAHKVGTSFSSINPGSHDE